MGASQIFVRTTPSCLGIIPLGLPVRKAILAIVPRRRMIRVIRRVWTGFGRILAAAGIVRAAELLLVTRPGIHLMRPALATVELGLRDRRIVTTLPVCGAAIMAVIGAPIGFSRIAIIQRVATTNLRAGAAPLLLVSAPSCLPVLNSGRTVVRGGRLGAADSEMFTTACPLCSSPVLWMTAICDSTIVHRGPATDAAQSFGLAAPRPLSRAPHDGLSFQAVCRLWNICSKGLAAKLFMGTTPCPLWLAPYFSAKMVGSCRIICNHGLL
mmetsp:Transcript_8060/g.18859  ORF Transcript_8060/g.18859 Transcript_8060/m.18859 type:complete len:268 (-) Transcript_8060:854-1657(-)